MSGQHGEEGFPFDELYSVRVGILFPCFRNESDN